MIYSTDLCKLPDACGIGIFHGDFGLVVWDNCGDGWLISYFRKFCIWDGENGVHIPIFGIARAWIYLALSPSMGQLHSNQYIPGMVVDFFLLIIEIFCEYLHLWKILSKKYSNSYTIIIFSLIISYNLGLTFNAIWFYVGNWSANNIFND